MRNSSSLVISCIDDSYYEVYGSEYDAGTRFHNETVGPILYIMREQYSKEYRVIPYTVGWVNISHVLWAPMSS